MNGLARWRSGGDGVAQPTENTDRSPAIFTTEQVLSVWVGARQTPGSLLGPGADARAYRQKNSERDPLTPESRRRQTWPAGRQKSEIRCRRLSRYDVRKILVRLGMHRVFNKLGEFTAEQRRVGSSLRREVHAVGVAGEDHVRSVRTRAHPSPASAAPLKPGQVDGVPGRHRRPLAPGGAILTAVEGQQLARRMLEQSLQTSRFPNQRARRVFNEHWDTQFKTQLNHVTR